MKIPESSSSTTSRPHFPFGAIWLARMPGTMESSVMVGVEPASTAPAGISAFWKFIKPSLEGLIKVFRHTFFSGLTH